MNRIRIRIGLAPLDPDPHWGKKLDPDPDWSHYASTTQIKFLMCYYNSLGAADASDSAPKHQWRNFPIAQNFLCPRSTEIKYDLFFLSRRQSCSQIPSPWIGDIVNSGKGLSYRPASLGSLVGWYDNPMPESTLSPQSGTMNLVNLAAAIAADENIIFCQQVYQPEQIFKGSNSRENLPYNLQGCEAMLFVSQWLLQ